MHPPGHPQAREEGCMCPSEANQEGSGTFNRVQGDSQVHFLVAKECLMHGESTWRESAPTDRSAA